MTVPPNYAVVCRTCDTTLWQSDTHPGDDHDGQAVATQWANRNCRRGDCPNTTTATQARQRQRPLVHADLEPLLARLAQLEKGRP